MATMYQANRPYKVTPAKGENVAVCRCGHSADPPFCDGTHKEHPPKGPKVIEGDGKTTLFVCGCGGSKHMPTCDGAHTSCPEHDDFQNRW